jgi:hypothetical protein
MASKTDTRDKRRRTTMVPVTTMEEIPVLSEEERAQLTASLEEAEARIKAGRAIYYDPRTFKDRLIGIYRGPKSLRIDPVALRQIEQFAAYLSDYDESFALEQINRLDRILHLNLGDAPFT